MTNSPNFIKRVTNISVLFLLLLFLGQTTAYPQKGRIIREIVHGKSLENTVTKENPDRDVTIYLPPGYDKSPNKRYPVIYFLHGIGDTDKTWTTVWTDDDDKPIPYGDATDVLNRGLADGKFGEMIVVFPNQKTNWFGSFYVNSSVTGNWEDFTVKELVPYIDKKYRTLANAKHRGLAGHSMGGYGAITIGMKHPDVFSVIYGMNPALVGWAADLTIDAPVFTKLLKAKTYQDLLAENAKGDFYPIGAVTVSQAFSPNPNKPPFYCDFPFKMVNGRLQPSEPGFSNWEKHFPVNMVRKYRTNLLKLRGLRFDSGYEDEFKFIPPNARALSSVLTNLGIPHKFEEYNGDHRNRIPGKDGRMVTEVLPYFWDLIKPETP